MKLPILAILTLVSIPACAPVTPLPEQPSWTIVVDPDVSADHFAAVENAAASWQGRVRCPFAFRVIRGASDDSIPVAWVVTFREVTDHAGLEPGAAGDGKNWIREEDGAMVQSGRVRVSDTDGANAGDAYVTIARHELGHAMAGLSHDDSVPALMNTDPWTAGDAGLDVSTADVARYEARWCPL